MATPDLNRPVGLGASNPGGLALEPSANSRISALGQHGTGTDTLAHVRKRTSGQHFGQQAGRTIPA
jgi:hypothetical protein